MRILVVDDDEVSRYLSRTILSAHGHEVETVSDGIEALEAGRREPPGLIITDILMPRMDGYRLCRVWKADPVLADSPLIFYTASYTDVADERFAINLGADAFLTKPQDPVALVAAVDRTVARVQAAGGANRPAEKGEAEVLREYSERLVHKLEQKALSLQSANAELKRAMEILSDEVEVKRQLISDLDAEIAKRDRVEADRRRLEMLKSSFVATVSHELRTPLTSIIGYAELLERPEASGKPAVAAELIDKVRTRSLDMKRLIEELLEVSQIQAEGVRLDLRWADLGLVVRERAAETRLTGKHRLSVEVGAGLERVWCDPDRLAGAVGRLLDNAVKYSPDGGDIRLVARLDDGEVIIEVFDQGIGMTADEVKGAFERFTQVDMSTTRGFGGFGLGLFIARQVALAHGGRIDVKSEPGVGSTFSLVVPLTPAGADE